jgi:hypothetical protein
MFFTITVDHDFDFLLVKASGPVVLVDLYGYMDLVATIAANTNKRRAVLALHDTSQSLSFTEHLNLGVYASERLRLLKRLASIVSVTNRTGTSEKAA